MVEHHGIAYHEKELGQLFCDESSKQVVRMLLDECEVAGVRVEIGCSVEDVRQRDGGGFALRPSRGPFTAASLVVRAEERRVGKGGGVRGRTRGAPEP